MENNLLELKNITKAFSGNVVLSDVSLEIKPGEVVSIIGENGAGKSTLMNILFGMDVIRSTGGYQGEILVHGEPVDIDTCETALQMGIGMVHQEFMLIEEYSIAENIKLNKENTKKSVFTKAFRGRLDLLDKEGMGADARRALDMVNLSIDEWVSIAGIPISTMQFVEIAKVLDNEKTRLIIFDEPTAVLTDSESQALLRTIEQLSAKGIASVLITHKLNEVLQVSDRIYCLRDGRMVGSFLRGEADAKTLARLMVNRDVEIKSESIRDYSDQEIILSVRDLKVDMPGETVKAVNLDVYKGEILGIAGMAGSGKLGIANGIRGLFPAEGTVLYKGEALDMKDSRSVQQKRIAFLSEDRKKVGLVLDETIEMNCILSSMILHDRFIKRRFGMRFIDRKTVHSAVSEMIEVLDIRCTGMKQKVGQLSGGNQQKVCCASLLLQEPELIFVAEPSRGIDIGAKQLLLDHLRKMNREQNTTIVMISSELHELRSMCDRIAIVGDGKVVGILHPESSAEEFGLLMAGS